MSQQRTITAEYVAKVDRYLAGTAKVISSTKAAAKEIGEGAKKNSADWDRIGNTALIAGGTIAAGIGLGVKSFVDFDSAMSNVRAALPDAGAEMGKLRQHAIDLGKDTQYSSAEAAQGITELAKAGVSAGDILGGGLKGALSLAAAGEIAVADAAEVAATAVQQFGLKGKDVAHVADLYAAAAGKAQGGVLDIANAMKYVGPVAHSMGISIEEATGTIALFASKGIIGEQAGTSFRSMLMSLTAPSKVAAGALEEYGIQVYDGQGKMKSMAEIAEILHVRLGGLDEATRNQALGQIFGNESMAAAIKLMEGGGAAVSSWTAKVNDTGFAAEQAALKTDNLRGDFERFTGALDAVAVQNGGGVNDFLRELTQGAEGAVEWFGRLPGPIQQGVLGLTALTGAGLLAVGAVSKVVTTGSDLISSLATIRDSGGHAAKGLDKVTASAKGLAVGGAVIAATAMSLKGLMEISNDEFKMPGIGQLTRDLTQASDQTKALDAAFNTAGTRINGSSQAISGFGDALSLALDAGKYDSFEGWVGGLVGVETKVSAARAQFGAMDETLASLFQSGHTEEANRLYSTMRDRAAEAGYSVDQINRLLPTYTDALANADAEQQLAAQSGKAMSGAVQGLGDEANGAEGDIRDLSDSIKGFGAETINTRSATADFEAAIDDATSSVRENGKTLDLGSAKGRANNEVLTRLAGAARDQSSATLEMTGSSDKATKALERGRQKFIEIAQKMGASKAEAKRLADEFGLMPGQVQSAENSIKSFGKNANSSLKGINNRNVNVGVYIKANERLSGLNGYNTGSGRADGGLVRRDMGGIIPGPYIGPRADNVLGVDAYGTPFVRVNPREFITRVASTEAMMRRRPGVLEYINAYGDLPPEYLGMRGFATGGRVTLKTKTPSEEEIEREVNASFARLMKAYGPSLAKQMMASSMGGGTLGGVGMGWRAQWNWAKANIPGVVLTSAVRTGNPESYHDKGRAIDLVGGPGLMGIFNAIRRAYDPSKVAGLYYSPAGRNQVRFGKVMDTPPHIKSGHYDHVHWQMADGGLVPAKASLYDEGGFLRPGATLAVNKTGSPEMVLPADLTASLRTFADGGYVPASRAEYASRPAPMSSRPIVNVTAPQGDTMRITGTLDTPFGPAQVRGVVQQEMSSTASKSRRQGVTA